jgi:hypothetical protein
MEAAIVGNVTTQPLDIGTGELMSIGAASKRTPMATPIQGVAATTPTNGSAMPLLDDLVIGLCRYRLAGKLC